MILNTPNLLNGRANFLGTIFWWGESMNEKVVSLYCLICHKMHDGSFRKSYCSKRCQQKAKAHYRKYISSAKNIIKHRKRGRAYYYKKARPLFAEDKANGIMRCICCQKIITKLFKDNRYCSMRCRRKALAYYRKQRDKSNVRHWCCWKISKEKCELCGAKDNLEIHHKEYKKDISACQVLCISCHRKLHRKKGLL